MPGFAGRRVEGAGDRTDDSRQADIFERMSKQLNDELAATGDPRVAGGGEEFDRFEYIGGAPEFPAWNYE